MKTKTNVIGIIKKYPFIRWVLANQIPFFGFFLWLTLRFMPTSTMNADIHYWISYFIALEVYVVFFYIIAKYGIFNLQIE